MILALTEWIQTLPGLYQAGVFIFSILFLSSGAAWILVKARPDDNWSELTLRIKAWWVMAGVFFAAVAFNRAASLVFFGLMSFWAFKEYVTILDTRRADHRALLWAFLAIPIQYYWAGIEWYGMFIIFIPVYMFLLIPAQMVMAQETKGFLYATSRIQWGLMAFVFGISHMAYLLTLPPLSGTKISGQSMLLFLVIMTEMNDVFQYLWGRTLGQRRVIPKVSPKKTWEGLVGGIVTTMIVAPVLSFLTPFGMGQIIAVAFLMGVTGFYGDVVMSAVKRDAGIKDFGTVLPGHGGMLDRVDSLCYTAPLFFHLVRYTFY